MPITELNRRREEAVRLRLAGATIDQAAAASGLSRPTVIRAFKAYQSGGWEATAVSRRGRRARRGDLTPPPPGLPVQPVGPQLVPPQALTHLQRLEAESVHILREGIAEAENPVLLYSIGKDSSVLLHLALKAFFPSKPPFPLLHIDTTWKFREMYAFRDETAERLGLKLIVHVNEEGVRNGINPFRHGSAIHTDVMKTQALRQAFDRHGFDVAFGGARRDEEASRAKERVFSFRSTAHRWDPKNQRPELWQLYNTRRRPGESVRVFPQSNWTELDVWQYIYLEQIPVVPLYLAKERPVVEREGMLISVDDDRLPLQPREKPRLRKVRFRTLGCYPLTGAIDSEADTLLQVVYEMFMAHTSERQGRLIDRDGAGSMERKKQEGYF
ncbi:MAG TPA: sulfate adenylyltransferase subunit CysD [Solirubrobacteraceae bacterium]|nr:sulfate adenylyltransferase subunit CysD [Solirubrobacteraceae bacterium]